MYADWEIAEMERQHINELRPVYVLRIQAKAGDMTDGQARQLKAALARLGFIASEVKYAA